MAVAMPKMTYGAKIWCNTPWKIPGAKQKTGSARVLHQLVRVQWMATLVINGALHTTPTDILDMHTGIPPLELTMLKVCTAIEPLFTADCKIVDRFQSVKRGWELSEKR